MTLKQCAVMVAVGFLGLYTVGLLAHRGALTVPNPERAALTGARAVVHAELERAGKCRAGGTGPG